VAAFVNVGAVQFGGSSNQVSVFNGQNMQNAWDSHSPNVSTTGTAMGQLDMQNTGVAFLNNIMGIGQPIVDPDFKNNGAPMVVGP